MLSVENFRTEMDNIFKESFFSSIDKMKHFFIYSDRNLLSVENFRTEMDNIQEKVIASIKETLVFTNFRTHMLYPFPAIPYKNPTFKIEDSNNNNDKFYDIYICSDNVTNKLESPFDSWCVDNLAGIISDNDDDQVDENEMTKLDMISYLYLSNELISRDERLY